MAKGNGMNAPQTWLPVPEAALAAGISEKALRRRIERGTVDSERDREGRRLVRLDSLRSPFPASTRSSGDSGDAPFTPSGDPGSAPGLPGERAVLAEVLKRLEHLAAENGKLRALTEVAESTEQRLSDELHRVRAELTTARERADAALVDLQAAAIAAEVEAAEAQAAAAAAGETAREAIAASEELAVLEADLRAAGLIRAWKLARARRRTADAA